MPEPDRHLSRPPLAEALLEIKWGVPIPGEAPVGDPGYPLIVGCLYERVRGDYPEVEHLVPQDMPVSMTPNMVRHRFRRAKGQWPLVQVGPGVLTLNETRGYRWNSFKDRAVSLLPELYKVYPADHRLHVDSLLLQYINVQEFDFEKVSVLEFLRSKMRTVIELPRDVFARGDVQNWPLGLHLSLTFPTAAPKGALDLNFGVGKAGDRPALIWELIFRSLRGDVPPLPDAFEEWLTGAHDLVEQWFFELAKGELLAEFERP